MSSRAGSHAGRGFRYQDSVAALFTISSWAHTSNYRGVVPEGGDDIELRGATGVAFAQVKSHREHLGDFQLNVIARYLRELWGRAAERNNGEALQEVLLILERGVEKISIEEGSLLGYRLQAVDLLGQKLNNHKCFKRFSTCTRILVLPNPREQAIKKLADKLQCLPIQAEFYFGAILQKVGQLSDENGILAQNSWKMLSTSDTQNEFDGLQAIISPEHMQAPTRDGICEAVDFITPFNDPLFYLGVDAHPGHLAAGLTVERPESRSRVEKKLFAARNVLIVGPSGSGKSALMWEVAKSTRHVVLWFQVHRLSIEQIPLLKNLLKSYRASNYAPIGFIFDDLGRGLADGWNALIREIGSTPGVFLLASIREEDLFLVTERAKAYEAREFAGQELAERIWKELHKRQLTLFAGWREPWSLSKGLLLEYTHILTKGERIEALLKDQVAAKIQDSTRNIEVDILRIVSAAGALGASVDIGLLSQTLDHSEGDMSRGISRLINEHLIHETATGSIGGLHQLRSKFLFKLLHDFPPPSPWSTIERTLQSLRENDLEFFLLRLDELCRTEEEHLIQALLRRILSTPSVFVLANILHGLDQRHLRMITAKWLEHSTAKVLPKSSLPAALMFGMVRTDALHDMPEMRKMLEASTVLQRITNEEKANDPRYNILNKLSIDFFDDVIKKFNSVDTIYRLMSSMLSLDIPPSILGSLKELSLNTKGFHLDKISELLLTARLLNLELSKSWVEQIGHHALLARVEKEIPWATMPRQLQIDDGCAIYGEIICVSQSRQTDLHADVMGLVSILAGITPEADVVIAKALDPDGGLAGAPQCPFADKRITRKYIPVKSSQVRYQRWWQSFDNQIAMENYTQYLEKSVLLLKSLLLTIQSCLNNVFYRSQLGDKECEAIDRIVQEISTLNPPQIISEGESSERGYKFPPFSKILFNCASDLIGKFINIKERSFIALLSWKETIQEIELSIAQEPWHFLEDGVPQDLLRFKKEILTPLYIMAGECWITNQIKHPVEDWRDKNARLNFSFRAASQKCSAAYSRRIQNFKSSTQKELSNILTNCRVFFREQAEATATVWPPIDVLVVIPLENFESTLLQKEVIRDIVGDGRSLTIVAELLGTLLPQFAQSGSKTLFPMPIEALQSWSEQIQIPLIELRRSNLFSSLLITANEISILHQFGFGAVERSQIEQEAKFETEKALKRILHDFELMLSNDLRQDLLVEIKQYLDNIVNRKINFTEAWSKNIRNTLMPQIDFVADECLLPVSQFEAELLELDFLAVIKEEGDF